MQNPIKKQDEKRFGEKIHIWYCICVLRCEQNRTKNLIKLLVGAVNGFIKQKALFGKRIKCIIVIKFLSNAYFSETIQVSMEIQANLFIFQVSHSTNMISLMLDISKLTLDHMYIPVVFISNNVFLLYVFHFSIRLVFRSTLLHHVFTVTIPNVCIFSYLFHLFVLPIIFPLCPVTLMYLENSEWWAIATYQIFTRSSVLSKEEFIKRFSKICIYYVFCISHLQKYLKIFRLKLISPNVFGHCL